MTKPTTKHPTTYKTNLTTTADMDQELQNAKDIGMLSVRLEAAVDRLTETAERLEKS